MRAYLKDQDLVQHRLLRAVVENGVQDSDQLIVDTLKEQMHFGYERSCLLSNDDIRCLGTRA